MSKSKVQPLPVKGDRSRGRHVLYNTLEAIEAVPGDNKMP